MVEHEDLTEQLTLPLAEIAPPLQKPAPHAVTEGKSQHGQSCGVGIEVRTAEINSFETHGARDYGDPYTGQSSCTLLL